MRGARRAFIVAATGALAGFLAGLLRPPQSLAPRRTEDRSALVEARADLAALRRLVEAEQYRIAVGGEATEKPEGLAEPPATEPRQPSEALPGSKEAAMSAARAATARAVREEAARAARARRIRSISVAEVERGLEPLSLSEVTRVADDLGQDQELDADRALAVNWRLLNLADEEPEHWRPSSEVKALRRLLTPRALQESALPRKYLARLLRSSSSSHPEVRSAARRALDFHMPKPEKVMSFEECLSLIERFTPSQQGSVVAYLEVEPSRLPQVRAVIPRIAHSAHRVYYRTLSRLRDRGEEAGPGFTWESLVLEELKRVSDKDCLHSLAYHLLKKHLSEEVRAILQSIRDSEKQNLPTRVKAEKILKELFGS